MGNVKNDPETQLPAPQNDRLTEQRREITGVLLIGITLLSFAAIFFDGAGFIGEILKRGLFFVFGRRGSFIPLLFLGILGCFLFVRRRGMRFTRQFSALILLFLWALLLIHLLSGVTLTESNWGPAVEGGGVVGHFMALKLLSLFGGIGTGIFMFIWLVITAILALNRPLIKVFQTLIHKPAPRLPEIAGEEAAPVTQPLEPAPMGKKEKAPDKVADNVIFFPAKERGPSPVVATLQNMLKEKEQEKGKEKIPEDHPAEPVRQLFSHNLYQIPDPSLVRPAGNRSKKESRIPDQSRQLEETLAQFGLQAKVIEVHHGPVITRYDLQPAPGVKVSRIVNLTDDLALALAARGLRLEAPIPGKAAIGIEVPNQEPQIVTFQDVLDSKAFSSSGKLSVALGIDIAGEVAMADLRKMPHLLIAGATGSGKSVCVNTLIMSILYKAIPDEVKFIMIDPKMVELSMYNGIPHLMAPVVTEAKQASGVLKLVITEMERRYKLFAEARVRDLEKYNAQVPEEALLPYIIVIIDELADLMMVAPVEVEDSICRLAQMARATGIHLVVATQRPSVDVITGLIKANIPSRIAFAVSSQIDSRTILDCMGAERLLGRGDMLFLAVGAMKPRRIQGALVTEKEIEAVIAHWKQQGSPKYQEQFLNVPENTKGNVVKEEDELFWDAVRVVVEFGQASASVLQRRLRIGYARAARLVDVMESKGIVGPYEGSKPREVYITARQMEEIKKRSQDQ
jgi:DNA segregation ATPase FtsK/SpoIIIE, S-DNA-T family